MTKIYFTRHGETVWNRQFRFQGHKDSELTDKGVLAAELLADRIEEIELDYIISSPLMRAYSTAEIVRGKKDVEIIKHNGLKEINLGVFEGMSYEDIKKEHPKLLDLIESDPINNRYPKWRKPEGIYNRVVDAFKEIMRNYRNKTT